ncbi:replication restart DNA helicase PriA [Mobilisporobacter senegalensis]|uniref:Replication restart DNA helicase PriA n=1 Tax=Mobilisporobacter senegalensis TaxID=1329262 RepID=A0A3N1Y2E8_9FIRM|nr:TFIIB-type zinc ribbon-containing protein [Mobilisporobacter senegalensis]ROR31712.1 replication restart DNA helicase PriA [Mobilisporobacter senegalensis]
MVIQYKCPNCGSDMAFDSNSGMLACDSCGRKDNIETFPKENIKSNNEDTHFHGTNNSHTFQEGEVTEYHCKNCGAVILTEPETTATTCSFCGAGVVLSDRLSGELAPVKVIPFTISKEQAQNAFKSWCKKGLLTPKGFMNADRIKSITGIYVPFWLYDLNGSGEVNATCTKVRTYSRGDYDYTETSFFNVYRNVDLTFLKVPVDASEKMNDKLMDKLEPYNYSNLKDFNTPYLAGFIAEKYNYTDKDLFTRAKERANHYVDNYIRSTINGYSTTTYNHKRIDISQMESFYTLLPVWMVCYDYKQSEHIFAMNGQTGKIVGTPPLSIGKIFTWFGGISVISLLILRILTFILGGGF